MKPSLQCTLQKRNGMAAVPIAMLLCIYFLHLAIPVAFYFDASFFLHRQWFPRFYVVTFLFFQSVIPLLAAIWSLIFIGQFRNLSLSPLLKLTCFLCVACVCHLLFHVLGFSDAIRFVFLLPLLHILLAIFKKLSRHTEKLWNWTKNHSVVASTGFFAVYILLCLLAPDNFHPFYRFSMYSKHESNKRIFTLIGPQNQLLPMEEYFYLTENAVGILYNDAVGYSRSATPIADSLAAPKLWSRMLTFKKKKFPFSSISLHKTDLYLKAGKIIADEHVLYTTKVE